VRGELDRDTSGWEIVKDRLWGFGHQIGVIEPQSNDSLWDQRSSALTSLLIWSALKRGLCLEFRASTSQNGSSVIIVRVKVAWLMDVN
jgi:hypothetical protein